jgi:septal ring factor EnvC (AmiA/AmiB activator)
MKNEDFERHIEFLLEQQARFDANLAKQQQQHAQWEARAATTDRHIEQLVGFAGTLRDALLGLTHHVERHDQQISANERAIAELAEQGKETDVRLNALIMIVERHVSGHQ